jgi:NADH-quinone oxidoreductase subunit M
VATTTIILGAAYVLWMVQRIFYGPESSFTAARPVLDLRMNEWIALVPLAALMLAMGIAPNYWMNAIEHMEGRVNVQQVLRVTLRQRPPMISTNTAAEAK